MSVHVEIEFASDSASHEMLALARSQINELQHNIATFVLNYWKNDDKYVCGLYSMTGAQDERYQILLKKYVNPCKYLKMTETETYLEYLLRRTQQIHNAIEQFDSTKDLMKSLM